MVPTEYPDRGFAPVRIQVKRAILFPRLPHEILLPLRAQNASLFQLYIEKSLMERCLFPRRMLINIMILWADSATTWVVYFPVLPLSQSRNSDSRNRQCFLLPCWMGCAGRLPLRANLCTVTGWSFRYVPAAWASTKGSGPIRIFSTCSSIMMVLLLVHSLHWKGHAQGGNTMYVCRLSHSPFHSLSCTRFTSGLTERANHTACHRQPWGSRPLIPASSRAGRSRSNVPDRRLSKVRMPANHLRTAPTTPQDDPRHQH